ncbi:hypothetical protein EDB80DRAFT_210884 [Ilyonectria destructans]|nr:hypothetical protein EDB80DRAFT_210884 [Ilyonectria destructans]
MKLPLKGAGDGLVLGVYAVLVQVRGDLAERCFAASAVRGQLTGPDEDLSQKISHVLYAWLRRRLWEDYEHEMHDGRWLLSRCKGPWTLERDRGSISRARHDNWAPTRPSSLLFLLSFCPRDASMIGGFASPETLGLGAMTTQTQRLVEYDSIGSS